MTTINTSAIYKLVNPSKKGSLESGFVYFKGVPVTYAKVQELVKKYQSEEREWQLTAFIDSDTLEQCEAMPINKGFTEVGKGKIKKGANRGNAKYPLDNDTYSNYAGMHGFSLSCPEFTKQGKKKTLKVLDAKGKPMTDLVGNGSICTIKCFAYRNRDEELVVTMDTIVVTELVPYEASGNGGSGFDDELGFVIPSDDEFGGEDMSEFEDVGEDAPFDSDDY